MANVRNVKVPVMRLVLNYYVSNEFGIPAMRYEKLPSEGIDISCLINDPDSGYTINKTELLRFIFRINVDPATRVHPLAWLSLFTVFGDIFYEPVSPILLDGIVNGVNGAAVSQLMSINNVTVRTDLDDFGDQNVFGPKWNLGNGHCLAKEMDLTTPCKCGGNSFLDHIDHASTNINSCGEITSVWSLGENHRIVSGAFNEYSPEKANLIAVQALMALDFSG